METPEFAAHLRAAFMASCAELERFRHLGDEEGVGSYESRVAYLRRIAAANGIDLPDPPDARGCSAAADAGQAR
jgi:hypothetical protein